jgi:hypothetical protein
MTKPRRAADHFSSRSHLEALHDRFFRFLHSVVREARENRFPPEGGAN